MTMQDVFDYFDKYEKAVAQGIAHGKVLGYAEVGLPVAEIACRVNITEDEVRKILQEHGAASM